MEHFVKHDTSAPPVAQGDIIIRAVERLPDGVVPQKAENGHYILAHSETGHHHQVEATPDVQFFQSANDNNVAYLVVNNETVLRHMRDYDTHEPYRFGDGVYEIRRQIESFPEGFRRVAD